jgi:hypothetical protein
VVNDDSEAGDQGVNMTIWNGWPSGGKIPSPIQCQCKECKAGSGFLLLLKMEFALLVEYICSSVGIEQLIIEKTWLHESCRRLVCCGTVMKWILGEYCLVV